MSSLAVGSKPATFFEKLFGPQENEEKKERKDFGDHIAKWVDSTDGAKSFFKVFDHALDYAKLLPNLSEGAQSFIEKTHKITDFTGSALSFPVLISDANNLRHSIASWWRASELPDADKSRSEKIVRSAKKSFLDSCTLTNTASQVITFLSESNFIQQSASAARAVDWVYNVTSLVTDGAELAEEAYKVHRNQGRMGAAKTEKEQKVLQEKINLSWLTIVKDVASVALSIIGIIALVFGALTQGVVIIAPIVLGLSTIWLAMKISAYFYERIIKERNKHPVA